MFVKRWEIGACRDVNKSSTNVRGWLAARQGISKLWKEFDPLP
jgi:hypothetical protein